MNKESANGLGAAGRQLTKCFAAKYRGDIKVALAGFNY